MAGWEAGRLGRAGTATTADAPGVRGWGPRPDKASYRKRAEELDAELHAAELAFADRLSQKTLVGIPTTYEALEELWDQKGVEFQRLLLEAVLEPITVKPAAVRGRKRFDPEHQRAVAPVLPEGN